MNFNPATYFAEENAGADAAFGPVVRAVETVREKTAARATDLDRYFHRLAEQLLRLVAIEARLADGTFADRPLDELEAENAALFADAQPANYAGSDLDPAGAARRFGPTLGPLLAWYAVSIRGAAGYAFEGRRFRFAERLAHFAEVHAVATATPALDAAALREAMTRLVRNTSGEARRAGIRQQFDPDFSLWREVAAVPDPADLRYLYRYGRRVTETERALARFLAAYPAAKIDRIAGQVVTCYLNGFRIRNRVRGDRDAVGIHGHIGQERITDAVVRRFEAAGLRAVVNEPEATSLNRQLPFDHRFAGALWVDRDLLDRDFAEYERAMAACRALVERYSGFAYIFKFGEPNFEPVRKPESLAYTPEQERLMKDHHQRSMKVKERYAPESAISFTAISFPSPEIGPRFPEIFDRMVEINTLDTERWEAIQQHLVDALDRADRVVVRGTGGNRTDMTVALRPLADPARQTKFVNCGADINIPVGEVFTSPVLKGTSGTLHLTDTWLNRFRYRDLVFTFRDGYVSDYGCANFPDPADGRRHVYENLMMPHATLPLGEFAIGTNTPAYAMAREFDILNGLTELVIEKMGPHFAIGDTCFLLNEDVPYYNRRDGKEMIARDNEKSACRHEDFAAAYTLRHHDITIPYEEIGEITALTADGGRIPLLRDGRFVLPGTEPLNGPLDGLAKPGAPPAAPVPTC